MWSLRAGWLLLIAVGFRRLAEGSVHFIRSPQGTVYYPPPGVPGKTFVCSTNASTNIRWVSITRGTLDPILFNITKVSETTSTMHLTTGFVLSSDAILATLTTTMIQCQTGTNETSPLFIFKQGAVLSITSDPNDDTVNEGQPVQFSCSYDFALVPIPTDFKWRITDRNGIVRMANQTFTPVAGQSGYQIPTVKPSDTGNYSCLLTNEFGTVASKPATLTVHYFGQVSLTVSPGTTVHDQTKVTVECSIDAFPMVTEIQLSRGDGPFFSSSNSSLNRGDLGTATPGTNSVTYTFTAKSDWTGSIACYGKNSAGSGEKSTNFAVQTAPVPPTLCVNETTASTHSLTYSFVLGNDGGSPITQVAISCYKVKGDDTLDKTDEYSVTSSDFKSPNCTTDVLTGLMPGTKYGCQLYATSAVGRSDGSARFDYTTVATAPAKPVVDASPVAVTETTLTVRWTIAYNGGKVITEYTVRRRATATGVVEFQQTLMNPVSQQEGTYMLKDLARGLQYYVDVEAMSSVGLSTSVIVGYTTACFPGTPGTVMVNTEVDSPDSSIKLTLEIPSSRGCGEISTYIVLDATGTNYTSTTEVTSKADGSVELFVSGLESDRQYSLRASVKNMAGSVSSPSVPVTFTTAAAVLTTAPSLQEDGTLPIGVIAGVVVVALVMLCVIIAGVVLWLYRRGKESATCTDMTATVSQRQVYEDTISSPGTEMQQSPVYGMLPEGGGKSGSEIRMHKSAAYGILDKQVTSSSPMYETVT